MKSGTINAKEKTSGCTATGNRRIKSKGTAKYENMDRKIKAEIQRKEITSMEHGQKTPVRVVLSVVYAYLYYRLLRVGKQSQAGGTYDHGITGEEYADHADAVEGL